MQFGLSARARRKEKGERRDRAGLERRAVPERLNPRAKPHRIGRIEQAVNRDLREHSAADLPNALRAGLRHLARQLDSAELWGDLEVSAKLGRVFLETLQAAGLAGQTSGTVDPFAAFVAGLSAPSMGDAADT